MRMDRYNDIDTNFQDFAENRGASFPKQVKEIYLRNWAFLTRNRNFLFGIFVQSFFISFLMDSIWWKLGDFPDL